MSLIHIPYSVFANKCPRCHQGKVLSNSNPLKLSTLLDTEKICSHCHLKYEKEVGFFTGALYVSYAMMSGMFIVAYVLQLTVLDWDTAYFALFMLILILATFPFVARWSRVLWLNLFVSYHPDDHYKDLEIEDKK
jgi:uncharacterized protein (DUF983 family)